MTTLTIQADRWVFDGVDLSTYAFMVRSAVDAEDLPEMRGEDVSVPYLPGRVYVPKLPDGRRMSLALYVTGMDANGVVNGPDLVTGAQRNLDALRALMGKSGRRPLVHVLPDGSTRTASAEVVSFKVEEAVGGRAGFLCLADLYLSDPFFYGSDTSVNANVSVSPTQVTFSNPGTIETHRVVIDVLGPMANPRVTNLANGVWVECLVTVEAGKHLVIDCGKWTAENDTANAIGSVRHSGDVRWFVIEPGTQTLSVTASAVGGSVTVTAATAYAA